jgi:hypothetical protein
MNERIIELADKAVEDISSGPWNISDEFCIKFAELIVKECARIIDEEALEERNDFAMRRIECCSWMIKEHFGVEE